MMTRRHALAVTLAGVILTACTPSAPKDDVTYYLVRHAEKTAEKPDPGLTDAGMRRSIDLANRLHDVPLTAVYSSDYIRTRNTAKPVSEMKGLELKIYDAGDLPGFAESLKTQTGHILVVGHSNTTPQLSELLGGEPGEPIVEATEYNRLYIITVSGDEVVSEIKTYGQ